MLNNDSFEQLLEESFKKNNLPEQGSIIEARVLQITPESVIVDVTTKTEASIPKKEFQKTPEIGDTIRVFVEAVSNNYIKLSHLKVLKEENIQKLQSAFENKTFVPGTITKSVSKGYLVQILGWEGFLPFSQAGLGYNASEQEKTNLVNKQMDFQIIDLDTKTRNMKLIVSLKSILQEKASENRLSFLRTLSVGEIISGKVIVLKDKSVLVEVDPNCVGLVRISDISWDRVKIPSDILKIGQSVSVKVMNIDLEKQQMLLSIKDAKGNIWEDFAQKNPLYSIVSGKILSVEPSYLIVKIQEGIQGLLHISNISWDKTIQDLKSMYKAGSSISVMIIRLDVDKHKVEFGIKQMEENPWATFSKENHVGSRVTGIIERKTDFALFVAIGKVTGILHKNDLSWNFAEQNLDSYKIGDSITATIATLNPAQEKFSLALKDMSENPWSLLDNVKEGDAIKVTVKQINGSLITLSYGILDIVMPENQVSKNTTLENGQEIEVLVSFINIPKKIIKVSMKELEYKQQKEQLSAYMNQQNNTETDSAPILGNMLDDFLKKK